MLQVLEQDDFAREKTVSRKAVSQRPSIQGDWNSSRSYLRNSVIRHPVYSPIDILNLATLLVLMVH